MKQGVPREASVTEEGRCMVTRIVEVDVPVTTDFQISEDDVHIAIYRHVPDYLLFFNS